MRRLKERGFGFATIAVCGLVGFGAPAAAEDRLLTETVDFTGTVLYLQLGVPGLVLGAVRNGETAVAGFGETSTGSGKTPDGDTLMRVGSVTKVFTGAVLASLVADGTVAFTDPLQTHIGADVTVPGENGHQIRLIDLATHTSGLPREAEREPGPADDPFRTLTRELYIKALSGDPLLFAPARDIGVFVAISKFDFAGSMQIAAVANDLIAQLAPR